MSRTPPASSFFVTFTCVDMPAMVFPSPMPLQHTRVAGVSLVAQHKAMPTQSAHRSTHALLPAEFLKLTLCKRAGLHRDGLHRDGGPQLSQLAADDGLLAVHCRAPRLGQEKRPMSSPRATNVTEKYMKAAGCGQSGSGGGASNVRATQGDSDGSRHALRGGANVKDMWSRQHLPPASLLTNLISSQRRHEARARQLGF